MDDTLRPYQRRIVDEREDLDARRGRLEQFMSGVSFPEMVSADEQSRLLRQLRAMDLYSDILRERIEEFTSDA